MSNQSEGNGTNDQPLFQRVDEIEADQDFDATRAAGSAAVGADLNRDAVLDTDNRGDGSVVVPAQSWPGGSLNMPVPPIGAAGLIAEPSEDEPGLGRE